MSDENLKTTVQVETTTNPAGIDQAIRKVGELQAIIAKFNGKGFENISKNIDGVAAKVKASSGLGDFDRDQKAAMASLKQRFSFERTMARQRRSEEREAAEENKLFHADDLRALREKWSFQTRMVRQHAQEVRDLARAQTQAARDAANAARDAAREQNAAFRSQIAQARELARERAQAVRSAMSGAGRIRQGAVRAAVIGGAGAAVVGAGARRGLDRLTESGVGIDEAMTQAGIHIYGGQSASESRKSAESLRKRLMGVAVSLGAKTSDLIGAYVEASQAGVDSDILDKVVGLGSKYAKMNKLSLPNTLEESGYALQGLKAFGSVTDKVVGNYFNKMSYLVATTAANRTQMSSFGKRGLAAGASVGMSADDTLAFGAAATAAGAEGNQAARMLSSQGGRIAGWEMRARDITRKSHKSAEDRLFLQAPQMMGLGSYGNIAAGFKRDFFDTFATVQERLKTISDPLKRRSIEKMLFGQEFGSFTDAMVMGNNLREYRNKLKNPEASTFIDHNWAKQTGSFSFIIDQIKSTFQNLKDSLGLALKPFWSDLRDYALKLPVTFGNVEDAFKVGLRGFMSGLGSRDGTLAGLLRQWMGDPAQFKLNTAWVNDFARGFGTGLREVGETIRRFMGAFTGGDTSAETIGRLTAKILGFSAALIVIAPVVSVLGAIGTALTGFAAVVAGAATALRTAGLLGGKPPVPTTPPGAPAGASGSALGRVFGTLGRLVPAFAAPLTMDPSKADNDRLMKMLGTEAERRLREREGTRGWVDPPTSRAIRESNDRLRGAVEDNTRVQRQSFEGSGDLQGLIHRTAFGGDLRDAIEKVGGKIQSASITGGIIARAAGTGTVGSAMGAAGIPYTPGAGGASLSHNTPGQAFSIPGVGSRYGVGGSVTDPRMNGDVAQRAKTAHDFFRSKGLSEEATAGILASMKQESAFNPGARGDGGRAHGLFQHHADRRAAIMAATGINMSTASFGQQLEGAWWEMNHGDAGAQRALRILRMPGISAREAGGAFVNHFERPARDEQAARGAPAEGMLRRFGGDASGGALDGNGGSILGRMQALKSSGRVIGDQCVALAKAAVGVSGSVSEWRKGVGAEAGTLQPGTPVATFLDRQGRQSSRYAGGGTGTMGAHLDHAGVFESYLKDKDGKTIGMRIAEQFRGSGGVRSKAYMFGRGWGEGNGSNYSAILGPDGQPLGGSRNPLHERAAKALGAGVLSKPQDVGDGIKGTGWKKVGPAELAAETPAQRLAREAPQRPQAGGAGAGGQGPTIHAPVHIHGVTDQERIGHAVSRHMQDASRYHTTDASFRSV